MLISKDNLELNSVLELVTGQCHALIVNNFIKEEIAESLAKRLLSYGYQGYTNAPSIGRIGMAFYEAENKKDMLDLYYKNAKSEIEKMRSVLSPYMSPIDTLRCQLEEIWPAGARLENIHGKKMFVGLSRVVDKNVEFLAHHDILEKDSPESFIAKTLCSQVEVNVYLKTPQSGGELLIWEKELSPDAFDRIRGDSYGISPKTLGDPSICIRPNPGQLILFNSRKMHAVTASQENDEPRVSLSCFLGYRGLHQPLTYWS